jgi:hypothetical protein|tara:strand:- start:5 stop:373 length:369 start_codon:yes stop_codon:yes gene_type:complete
MDIFKKDMILKKIASEINSNKQNIGSSVADLYELKNKNSHLRGIYDEKKQCHNTIVNLKKDQEIQILRLLHYLEKSLIDADLTNKMIGEAKHEQQILIKKLKNIQGDISNMTEQVKTTIDEN